MKINIYIEHIETVSGVFLGVNSPEMEGFQISVRDHQQISLLISSNFKWINFYPPEIIAKPKVFVWFLGEYKFLDSLKFAQY